MGGKKNQYYKLIEYVQKDNIAKVFNFRTNKVEIYVTKLTNKEKYIQQKNRLEKKKIQEESTFVLDKNDPVYKMYQSINYYSNLYMIYSKLKLSRNYLIKSILINRYLKQK